MAEGSATSFVFDSEAFHEEDRFDAYRQLYAGGSDVEVTGPGFRARVEAQRLGRLLLFERRLNGVSHERTPRRVRGDGFEHFTLQLNLSGRLLAEVPEGTRQVAPGEIIVFDMTRPQRTQAENVHFLTFSVAPDVVEAACPNAFNLHGRILSGPQAGILADLMVSLVRRRISEEPKSTAGAVQMFHHALALALNTDQVPPPEGAGEALQRVKLLIEGHLARRDLSPAWLARTAGLSRTRLYDLFKPVGGISRYIQKRRAARLRTLLARPETRGLGIGNLALQAGFASESHATRTFSEHFGISPGQHRRALDRIELTGRPDEAQCLAEWVRTLY